jgi:Uma2 family endonuclease
VKRAARLAGRLRVRYGRQMVAALKLPPRRMTVAEFLAWDPDDGSAALWQLRDGEPEMMAPASERHGRIQAELAYLLTAHLRRHNAGCSAVIDPGVIPRVGAEHTILVPDIGITCAPVPTTHAMANPVVLIEILSPSNEAETRANVWAFATIPTVAEIVIVSSVRIAAEVLRRGADGAWPAQPEPIGPDGTLRLDSIGFAAPLRDVYRSAGLD